MRLSIPFLLVLPFASALSVMPRKGMTIPLAKRTPLADDHGVVRLKVLQDQLASASRKIQAGFEAFRRNTDSIHHNDKRRSVKRAEGSIPLTDENGALWYGAIAVGTPEVVFTVAFDTGSSDLFLPSASCESPSCDGHTRYDTDASSTAKPVGRKFGITFGDNSTVEGDVFEDTVSIAGLTASDQAVGAALSYSSGLAVDQFPPDGLLGMAFKEISGFGANPLFQTLVAQGVTTAPQFGFKLATPGSRLFLGGVDATLFTGQLTWVPVTKKGFWQVDLDAIHVSGEPVVPASSAIIDTGSTLVYGNSTHVRNFYSAIPGSRDASDTVGEGFFTFPCNTSNSLEISLTFGARAFRIAPDHFNVGQVSQGSDDCVGGVAANDDIDATLDGVWLVGDVFLQSVYTAFDVGTEAAGFATLA